MAYTCDLSRFLRDTKQHRMTILSDDGVNRHVRFSKPHSSTYRFDLRTWAGFLCISGDCGTYVFSRTRDMFEFFGDDDRDPHFINPRYWGEKLEAIDKNGGYEQFSSDKFKNIVRQEFKEYDFADKAERKAFKCALIDNDWGGNVESMGSAYNFFEIIQAEAYYDGLDGFRVNELWDHDLSEYTFRFIWCCRAIRWGIRQYQLGGDRFERQAMHGALVLAGKL